VSDGGHKLKNDELIREISALSASYRAGSAELDSLSYRAELLVEQMRACLSDDGFSRAMNCVYIIEEINALVLDENRQITQSEQGEIESQLALLEKLVTGARTVSDTGPASN